MHQDSKEGSDSAIPFTRGSKQVSTDDAPAGPAPRLKPTPMSKPSTCPYREVLPQRQVVDVVGDVELQEGEADQVRHVEPARVPQLLPWGEVHVAALLFVYMFVWGWVAALLSERNGGGLR